MIDLGHELTDYTDDEPPQPQRATQPTPRPGPHGGTTIPLADLQAAGFQTTDPYSLAIGPGWRTLARSVPDGLTGPSIQVKTWLTGDE